MGRGRGRGRGRGQRNRVIKPYAHLEGMSIKSIALGYCGSRCLKVSSESSTKKVAGAIAHCVRIGGVPPSLLAKGIKAINQAVKAIAKARTYLEEEDADLVAQPAFEGQSSACILHVRRASKIELDLGDTLTVTNKTNPYKLAGAIAGKIREKERVALSAIGAQSVMHAVEALAVSRGYLKNERIDVKFVPQFNTVEISGKGEMESVYFACLYRRV